MAQLGNLLASAICIVSYYEGTIKNNVVLKYIIKNNLLTIVTPSSVCSLDWFQTFCSYFHNIFIYCYMFSVIC